MMDDKKNQAKHGSLAEVEFVNSFTPLRFPNLSISPEKRKTRDIFAQDTRIENGGCFIHLF